MESLRNAVQNGLDRKQMPAFQPGSTRDLALKLGLSVPISLHNLITTLNNLPPAARTYHQNVTTPSGTALGGWRELTLRSDGTYTFSGSMHDSDFDPYDFRVRAVLSAMNVVVVGQKKGHTDGTGSALPFGTPNRDFNWSELGTEP